MASIKIASLFLKTLAKPLANNLKSQAKEHEGFRKATIAMAQFLHRAEMNMRIRLLGEDHPKHIRPLNDAKAIDSGANFISETFLFGFATLLILGETWRSRRKDSQRRDLVAETLEQHEEELKGLRERLDQEAKERASGVDRERELEKIVEEVVSIGVRGGWLEVPSSGWESHVRLSDQTRQAGKFSVLNVRSEEDKAEESTSAIMRELSRIEKVQQAEVKNDSNV
ncbi:OPA3-domain-containing protein [Meredithblackwellia eburnea MCA 4105]